MSTYAKRYPSEWKYLYNSKAWKSLRLSQLRREPLCRMCGESDKVVAATVVDHIKRHKGNHALFHDSENLQSLCVSHHNSSKKKAEMNGVQDIGCDESGTPRDKGHHWAE